MALQYCISRGAPGAGSAGAVSGRMGHFAFAPVETQHGSYRMAVDYAPSSTITVLKDSTAPAPMAQVPFLKLCRALHHLLHLAELQLCIQLANSMCASPLCL